MKSATLLLLLCWSVVIHAADIGPAAAAATANDPGAPVNLAQITLSLLLIVGLLVGASVLFKKFGLNRMINHGALPIKVIGATSLGANQRLIVIEVGEQWIVLGVTPQQINHITSLPRQAMPDSNADGKPPFANWMHSALEKYNAKKNP
jgi:flagellar protein FliO/FliZ